MDSSSPLPSSAADFFSNDYLSLTNIPEIRKAFLERASRESQLFGSTGSRLLTGNSNAQIQLEQRLQKFFDGPSALLFNSGFDANVAFFSAVPGPRDVLLMDEFVHASAHDGIATSRVKNSVYTFQHNSLASFETCIRYVLGRHPQIKQGDATLFVALESLYSMEGDFCPLLELLNIAEALVPTKSLHFVLDEAHTTGLFGPEGRGYVSMLGAERRVHSVLHTFGKARNFHGAVLLTTPAIKLQLANYGRAIIYTTSLPHVDILALTCICDFLESAAAQKLRGKLFSNAKYFCQRLTANLSGIPGEILRLPEREFEIYSMSVTSPIIPVYSQRCRSLQAFLRGHGYSAQGVISPMVPKGKDRMRIVIHAGNSERDIDELIERMKDWAESEMRLERKGDAVVELQSRL